MDVGGGPVAEAEEVRVDGVEDIRGEETGQTATEKGVGEVGAFMVGGGLDEGAGLAEGKGGLGTDLAGEGDLGGPQGGGHGGCRSQFEVSERSGGRTLKSSQCTM